MLVVEVQALLLCWFKQFSLQTLFYLMEEENGERILIKHDGQVF